MGKKLLLGGLGCAVFSVALLTGVNFNSNRPPLTNLIEIDKISSYVYSNGEKRDFQGLKYFEVSLGRNLAVSYYPYQNLDGENVSFPFFKIEEYSINDGISMVTRDCGLRLDKSLLGDNPFKTLEDCGELVDKVNKILSSQ